MAQRQQDEDSTINQLPTEILVKILYLALQGSLDHWFDRLHTIAQVCTLWAGIAKTEPSFWAVLLSSHTPKTMQRVLERSKSAPLDVQYNRTSPQTAGNDIILDKIIAQAYRWRSAKLMEAGIRELGRLGSVVAPFLEDLTLIEKDDLITHDLLGGSNLDRLRYLTLEYVALTWRSNAFSDLRTLSLSFLEDMGPSMDLIFEMRRASPSLAELTLRGLLPTESTAPQAPIHLPDLKQIMIIGLPPVSTHDLFATLRIPNCTFASIRPASTDIAIFDSSTEHIIDVFRSILSTMERIELTVRISGKVDLFSMNFNQSTDRPDTSVGLYLTDLSLVSAASWLIPLFPVFRPDRRRHIGLNLKQRFAGAPELSFDDHLAPILRHLSQASELVVHHAPNSTLSGNVIRFLATPTTTYPSWPLAGLRNLSFQGLAPDMAALVDMVRRRYGGPGEGVLAGMPPPLALLDHLHIEGQVRPLSADFQALRGMLPEGVLRYNGPGGRR